MDKNNNQLVDKAIENFYEFHSKEDFIVHGSKPVGEFDSNEDYEKRSVDYIIMKYKNKDMFNDKDSVILDINYVQTQEELESLLDKEADKLITKAAYNKLLSKTRF